MNVLTTKQERFCRLLVEGMDQGPAYAAAYDWQGKVSGRDQKASILAARKDIQDRIQKLRDMAAKPTILTRQRKLEKLARMVEAPLSGNEAVLTSEQLKAMEIDNKIQGHNEPETVRIEGAGALLQKIRKGAPKP